MKITARFDCDIPALAKQLQVDADIIKRKIALDIFARLLAVTPVDTGRARAGWSVSASGASYYQKVKRSAPEGWKKGDAPYYQEAKSSLPAKGAPRIYIYNNVEYIGTLNDGTSTQAPKQFVEIEVGNVMRGLA